MKTSFAVFFFVLWFLLPVTIRLKKKYVNSGFAVSESVVGSCKLLTICFHEKRIRNFLTLSSKESDLFDEKEIDNKRSRIACFDGLKNSFVKIWNYLFCFVFREIMWRTANILRNNFKKSR